MSGHSRWAQIKHKKSATDAKRGRIFSKLAGEITRAARSGEADETVNLQLRSALSRARAAGLPKDTIERALARAKNKEADENLSEFLYEASLPHGVMILIEGVTDSKNRTSAELKHILLERGGRMADSGSLAWNFEKTGIIEAVWEDNPGISQEAVELAAIEAGARDIASDESAWIIETAFTERERVREALEKALIAIRETGHDYKAKNKVTLSAEERLDLEPILEALLDHDDVQEVYTNLTE